MKVVIKLLKRRSFLKFSVLAFIVCSCVRNDSFSNDLLTQKVDSLKNVNAQLKVKLDSVETFISREEIGAIAFENFWSETKKEGDSLEIIVAPVYSRPNFYKKLSYEVFDDKESMNEAIMSDTYQFKNEINLEEMGEDFIGVNSINFTAGQVGTYYLGGTIFIQRDTNNISLVPFSYPFEVVK